MKVCNAPDVRLYALLDTVGAVLQCSADVKAACEETRADLAEVIRAVLTPECEFETCVVARLDRAIQ
jgi:hypothetical protein